MLEDDPVAFEATKDAILGVLSGLLIGSKLRGRAYVTLEEIEGVMGIIQAASQEDIYGATSSGEFEPTEQSIEDLLNRLGE